MNNISHKDVLDVMAEYFLNTQDAQCLLCDNNMKHITVDRSDIQGCDGNCMHYKVYTKEDLIQVFINAMSVLKTGDIKKRESDCWE